MPHPFLLSYQVLEEWGGTEHRRGDTAEIQDYRQVRSGFEAIWSRNNAQSPHLLESARHLRKIVPGIVRGLQPIAKR